MKIVILSVFLLTPLMAIAQIAIQSHYNGKQLLYQEQVDTLNNCKTRITYYPGGQKQSVQVRHYPSSEVNDTSFYTNGETASYRHYKNGILSGRAFGNYKTGRLAYERFYANGYKAGTWKEFDEDGLLKTEEIFNQGTTAWDSNDDNAVVKVYNHGKLAYITTLSEGKTTDERVINKQETREIKNGLLPLGKRIFVQNCASCHRMDKDVVGPKLQGVVQKRSTKWLKQMIINGDALKESGDKDAIDLYQQWHQIAHPHFERLSPKELAALIQYIKKQKG